MPTPPEGVAEPRHRLVPEGAAPPLAILGVTASGKSALAMRLARDRGDVELVSVDSMQVYRGMDVGTAKPTAAERAEIRHHVLDLVDPWDRFEVHSFQQAVADALADIHARGRKAVLVGGTGMYLQAVVDGFEIPGRYPQVREELEAEAQTEAGVLRLHQRLRDLDPLAASRMEPNNERRVVRALEVTVGSGRPFSSFGPGVDTYGPTVIRQVGLRLPEEVVAERIARRYDHQLADGFLEEARMLAAGGPNGEPVSRTAAQALGYRELLAHLAGEATLEEAVALAVLRTRQFARRQRRWFRRDPRIVWLDAERDAAEVSPRLAAEAARLWDR